MLLTASAHFVSVVKTMKIISIFSFIAPYTIYLVEFIFDQLFDVLGLDIASISGMDDDTLCHRLLFGDPSLGTIENKSNTGSDDLIHKKFWPI